jgi:peptidoglycan/LPS O-acetylase OafA/YrhL
MRAIPASLFSWCVSYFTIVGRINQFMIGIGLAYLFDTGRFDLKATRMAGLVVLAIASAAALALLMVLNRSGGIYAWHLWHVVYPEVEGLSAAAFIAAYLVSRPLLGTWASGALMGIGTVSFSLYILHYAMQREFWNIVYPQFLGGVLTGRNGVFMATIMLAVPIIAMAALSYRCIEKPFQEIRGRKRWPQATRLFGLRSAAAS